MKLLYAPWRDNYIKSNSGKSNCPFCDKFKDCKDAEHFIIKRLKYTVIMLNLHPYNAGHLLIIPFSHQSSLELLASDERVEIMETLNNALIVIKETLRPQGINIGINLGGKAAGGSVPEHLHVHLVPRFLGDTNFLTTISDTNVIGINLTELYQKLKLAFDSFYNRK